MISLRHTPLRWFFTVTRIVGLAVCWGTKLNGNCKLLSHAEFRRPRFLSVWSSDVSGRTEQGSHFNLNLEWSWAGRIEGTVNLLSLWSATKLPGGRPASGQLAYVPSAESVLCSTQGYHRICAVFIYVFHIFHEERNSLSFLFCARIFLPQIVADGDTSLDAIYMAIKFSPFEKVT